MRYRLDVVAADVADVVKFAGGWLFDRAMAGWDVTVLLVDHPDERPLQSRRSYLLGRWAGLVYMRAGRVVRVEEFPHLEAALEAAGIEDDHH